MTPLICFLCLLLSVAFPGGGSPSVFAHASSSSIRKSSSEQNRQLPLTFSSSLQDAGSYEVINFLTNETDSSNNTTNSSTFTLAPTPAVTPMPTPTHSPTKHYEPSPDDNDEDKEEEKKKGPNVGMIFLWIFISVSLIWLVCYFRDAIFFFFGNAWNNTRRYGCKGCLQSFFPCIVGSPSSGSEPLDQIIFETEEPNTPLMSN